jgi:putative sigma-54 modulation protein
MRVNIESPQLEISEDLRNKVMAQFNHLKTLFDRIIDCDVVLRKINNGRKKNCDITARVQIPKSTLFSRDQAETFEIALTRIVDNLVRQLKREKEARREIW